MKHRGDGGPPLPRGTVTLLLADVEGSTRLWERSAADMGSAMSDLDAIVDELVAKFDGGRPVEQGEGDSFVAGFARASDAVGCALEIQQRLTDGSLRLRMALHTGEVEVRDEARYDGPTIIRAARIRDLGHGGQVLVSSATADLVQDTLPADADLLDLGSHALKGLSRPLNVFQLTHPLLVAGFPPLRTMEIGKGSLPVRLTSFVGRTEEVAQVQRLVRENRLVTLTGAGGCGKTRLGIEAVEPIAEEFPDGVWFCDLGPLADPEVVAQSLRVVLGLPEDALRDDIDVVCGHLASAKALVVIDNCEHLVDASASLADTLLRKCAALRVLTTTREPLGVEGEVSWRVPSLPFPEDTDAVDVSAISNHDAVKLFTDRAAQGRPNFAVTEDNARTIAEICRRLDGIPLAIELAAARVRVLSVEQIATGLSDRFRLLGRGARTLLARQQTLLASVGWSHDLLTDDQKVVLRRLAVFAGGFTLEAAETVVAGDDIDPAEVLELLSQLVDRSLVVVDETPTGSRYRMLETIRQFARDRLLESGDAPEVGTRHLEWFTRWTRRTIGSASRGQRPLVEAFDLIDDDYDNIRVACEWAVAEGRITTGLRLATALSQFVGTRTIDARFRELRRWLTDLLREGSDVAPDVRAWGLVAVAFVCGMMNDLEAAVTPAAEALPIARELGPSTLLARTLWINGAHEIVSRPDVAIALLEESAAVAREVGDPISLGFALGHLTQTHLMWRADMATGLAAAEAAGHSLFIGFALLGMGRVDEAKQHIRTANAWNETIGNSYWHGLGLAFLSQAEMAEGNRAEAVRLAESSIAMIDIGVGSDNAVQGALARFTVIRVAILDRRFEDADRVVAALLAFEHHPVAARPRIKATFGPLRAALAALLALARGDPGAARSVLYAALDSHRTHVIGPGLPALLVGTLLQREDGEILQAESDVMNALTKIAAGSAWLSAPDFLAVAGALRGDVGADAEAVRLLAAAHAGRERMGIVRQYDDVWDEDAEIAKLRERMGAEAFDEAWAAGESLSIDEAVDYALRGRGPRQRPAAGWDSLTPTERQVVDLVAEGLSNKQVAEKLFVSPRTVSTHLSHIFAKLGVSSRAELAATAAKRL